MVVECKCGPHVSTQTSAGDSDYSATRMCYINRRVYYFPMAEFTFSVMHSCIQLFLVNHIQFYVDYMGKTSVGSNRPSSYQTALSQHVHVWFNIGSFWLHSVGHIWFQARNFSSLDKCQRLQILYVRPWLSLLVVIYFLYHIFHIVQNESINLNFQLTPDPNGGQRACPWRATGAEVDSGRFGKKLEKTKKTVFFLSPPPAASPYTW